MIELADIKAEYESPEYLQTSLAAAMTMGLRKGKFYRNAKLYCINLLLTYEKGCRASCAFCGLSKSRQMGGKESDKSFIRVEWPLYKLDTIVEALNSSKCDHVERVCVSMVTNKRAVNDLLIVNKRIHQETTKLLSSLISPTIVNENWLIRLRQSGTDKVGIALDAATPELFEQLRGAGVKGPHKWEKYWDIIHKSLKIFRKENVGIHLIVGLGETEEEMAYIFQKIYDLGAKVHLFSFFPEMYSKMEHAPQPGIGQYRRMQLLRYLLEKNSIHYENLLFNSNQQIIDFGIDSGEIKKIINSGTAFKTSGCSGSTLDVACNRPFANSTPFQAYMGECRNYPFDPSLKDIKLIEKQLKDYSNSYLPPIDQAEIAIKDDE
ncbi:MAG: radical SAM protein [Candidatus Helarchaeota archaeon]